MPSNDESTPLLPQIDPAASDNEAASEDDMSALTFWRVGAALGAAGVGLGAFGAHGLKSRISDPQRLANWSTAAHYQVLVSFPFLLLYPYFKPS